MTPADIPPHNMIPGWPAAVVVWTLHVAIPLTFGVLALVRGIRASRQAHAADAEALADTPLAPGRACIHGPVEYAPGQNVAVGVVVEQVGQNHKGKNDNWSHSWTELERKVTSAPFYIRDDRKGGTGGTRIRVEPDDQTLLVDKLDRTFRRTETSRERSAEIGDGEVVYVVGELIPGRDPGAGGYRDTETVLVMKPPSKRGGGGGAGGRLLVSSEPLGERFRRDARGLRGFAIVFFLFMLVFAVVDIGYHARVFAGHVETGKVTAAIAHGGKSAYCELQIELVGNGVHVGGLDTDKEWCGSKRLGEGTEVPVYVVGASSFSHLGLEPAVHVASFGISFVLLAFALLAYKLRSRAWYESKVNDAGPGKLSESRD